MAFEDRKFDLIAESDWKWWVIGKGVLTVLTNYIFSKNRHPELTFC
jgi:hypothetical protein